MHQLSRRLSRCAQQVQQPLVRPFSLAVKFAAYGDPKSVLKLEKAEPLKAVGASEVSLKILASPVNPADINFVQGVYGVKADQFPATPGGEGVAEVVNVGSSVKSLKAGDWVIPHKPGIGFWRQELVISEDDVLKIPNDILPKRRSMVNHPHADLLPTPVRYTRVSAIPYAATLGVNPCTAYRLLKDFVALKPGDVIIQNGANSMVGQAVVQMARNMGVKTINIVRSDRPACEKELKLLTNLGGNLNVPDYYVNTPEFRDILKDYPACKLALNCVGGDETTEMVRSLAIGATVVTYGGMSKRPFVVPFDLLTQKQLSLKGFWISKWNQEHSKAERSAMIEEIIKMIRNDQLSFFYEVHDFDDFTYALDQALEPFRFRKVILRMDYPDRLADHDSGKSTEKLVFDHWSGELLDVDDDYDWVKAEINDKRNLDTIREKPPSRTNSAK